MKTILLEQPSDFWAIIMDEFSIFEKEIWRGWFAALFQEPNLFERAYELDMDVAVEAIGQAPPEGIDKMLPGVEFKSGLICTEEGSLATSRPGIFAGGDLVRGASTVVSAVADGMAAAKEIDEFLRQKV